MHSKFLICESCNQLIHQFGDENKQFTCCGNPMKEIMPNTVEASVEKHVPVAEVQGNKLTVRIGVTDHPQTPEHYISWIYVKCGNRTQGIALTYKDNPIAEFYGDWSGKVEVQAYCKLHGIWLSTIIC